MTFAEAKGLKPGRLFFSYGMRNAILPQVTALALYFGQIVTGAVLVEIVFSYPGLGSLLLDSIKLFDFPTIYGIVFILTLTVALSMLAVDLLYPSRPARPLGRPKPMSDRVVQIAEEPDWGSLRGKLLACGRYLARNPSLIAGAGPARRPCDVLRSRPVARRCLAGGASLRPAEHRRRARPFRSAPIRRAATSSPS